MNTELIVFRDVAFAAVSDGGRLWWEELVEDEGVDAVGVSIPPPHLPILL